MPLRNFGSILTFAAELEKADKTFYAEAAENPECSRYREMLEGFSKQADKNLKLLLRARQENVTEMILENIENFTREPFISSREDVRRFSANEALAKIRELEEKASLFYAEASERLKALPEVSRTLKSVEKRHRIQLEKAMGP